jgi:hypothetical protein
VPGASWRGIGRAFAFAVLLITLAPPADAAPTPGAAAIGWSAVDATWTLRVRPDEPVQVEAAYRFANADGQPAELRLVGVGLLLLEAPGGSILQASGLSIALPAGERASSARLSGLYTPPRPGSFQLNILPAATTRVVVDAPGFDVTLPDVVNGLLPPTVSTLRAEWAPHQDTPPRRQSAIVRGESASTFQAESGALVVDSRVRWQVLRGETSRFAVDVKGLEDLTITGSNIASWEQSGGTATVRTQSPVRQSLDIRVTGRAPLRKGEVTIPIPTPAGVTQTERWVTLARSDEGALIPTSAPPAVALTRVPAWARGLGSGAPLAAWQGNKPVTVLVASAEPIDGPPVLVTMSRYVVAAAQDGRLAVRQALRVRNERRQYLKVTPPGPGGTLLVARVGNQPRTVSSDGRGGYLVPLDRSEETVRGPLSFPVDLEWIAEGAAWGSKGEQALRLPAVDAPVQAASWEVHLPRGFAREGEPEETSGGFIVTDLRAADLEQQRKAQELAGSAVQKALDAWRSNDFAATAQWLEQVRSADPTNEEAAALAAAPGTVELPWPDFERLYRAWSAQEQGMVAPAPFTIDRAELVGTFEPAGEGGFVRLRMRLRGAVLAREGWTQIPLLRAGVALQSARVDGKDATVYLHDGAFKLLRDKPGPFTVELDVVAPTQEQDGVTRVTFPLPAASAAALALAVDSPEPLRFDASGAVGVAVTDTGDTRRAELFLPPRPSATVSWRRASADETTVAEPRVYAEVRTLAGVDEARWRVTRRWSTPSCRRR